MPYKINNFEYLKNMLVTVSSDDLSLPWDSYPCLDWERGATGPNGYKYGTMRLPMPLAHGPHVKAHRMAYQMVRGAIPEGFDVCHHCDRPICFRPVHLFTATATGNMQDMLSKGRHNQPKGVRQRSAKLTEDQVREMRRLYASGIGYTELGRRFGVTLSVPYHVITGRTWKHVD